MSANPLGRMLNWSRREPVPRVVLAPPPPKIDIDSLAERVRREVNIDRRAAAFLTYLRAAGVTGEVSAEYLENRYWQVLGGPATTDQKWKRAWKSLSRAMGKSCKRRQVRDEYGVRRHVVYIPSISEVPK